MFNTTVLRALGSAAVVALAWPAGAQVITSLPFGQRNTVMTPLPFGQRSVSPLQPINPMKRKLRPATATMVGNVVAQWNMDETSGTTMLDATGNGNNGTTTNIQMTGAGYIFDGSTSKVTVPNSPTLTPQSSDFSYTVTFQTSLIPAQHTDYDLIRKGLGGGSGGEYKLEIVYDRGIGKPKCVIIDSMSHNVSQRGNINVADGQVHTVTCTRTGNTLTQQVDSRAPTTATGWLSAPINTVKPLTLGVKSTTAKGIDGDWFPGTIINASVSVVQ